MDIQPDYRRLLTTIHRQEPDRVPLAELSVDRPVKEKFMGKQVRDVPTEVEFWWKAGYDYLYLRPDYEFFGAPAIVAAGTPRAWEASGSEEKEAESISTMKAGPIQTLADLDTYPWPDPQTVDCSNLEEAASLLPDGMGIISGVGGIFTRTWMTLGYEHFCLSLADAPELVARVFERVGRIQCEVLRRVVKMPGVFAVWYGDDLAYTEALLVSPQILRQHLFPWMEELASIAHGAGMPFILHSDGVLWQVLDDLVALGLNALHPIEPKAMDINEVKARYGDKLALFGNLDLGSTLTRGTPDEVRAEVRQRIKELAPGGGYAVGSSNSVTRYVPVENFNAMREAAFEYGVYPIRI
ncbi:MAG: uroporphyrinogen decarboxylase family protein [Chloroflexota bacterium]